MLGGVHTPGEGVKTLEVPGPLHESKKAAKTGATHEPIHLGTSSSSRFSMGQEASTLGTPLGRYSMSRVNIADGSEMVTTEITSDVVDHKIMDKMVGCGRT